MLKWGKVKKRTTNLKNLLQGKEDYLKIHDNEHMMQASIMYVYGVIEDWDKKGMDMDIFEIVWFD